MSGPPALLHIVEILKEGGPGAAVGGAFGVVLTAPQTLGECKPAESPISHELVLEKCTALVGVSYTGVGQWTFLTEERWWGLLLLFVAGGAVLGWLIRRVRGSG